MRVRQGQLFTSAEAARLFRVGVSSIKRWTDEGELESVRTPGKHRRYTLLALHRFASIRKLPVDLLPPLGPEISRKAVPLPADVTLYQALRAADGEAVKQLVAPPPGTIGQRAAFLDRVVGDALREIGERWMNGELSVDEEHRATQLIAETLDRLRPERGTDEEAERAPMALLACPPGELHALPLQLVRLVLEWRGWHTDFFGASLPYGAMRNALARRKPELVGLSSRSSDAFESLEFEQFVTSCNEQKITVVVGGEWARGGSGQIDGYIRFRTLRGFERWLREFERGLQLAQSNLARRTG